MSNLPPKSFSRICVFCGSSMGNRPSFQRAAQQLGQTLLDRGIGLVYGGGSVGLMGEIARTVAEGGGSVVGIIPGALKTKEIVGTVYGELIEVETMHERKAKMANLADAFIALPGGYGTLDELFEIVTWGQLGIHQKPIGLLNVEEYFTPLLQWVENALAMGFVRPQHRAILTMAAEAATLLDHLAAYTPAPGLVSWENLRR